MTMCDDKAKNIPISEFSGNAPGWVGYINQHAKIINKLIDRVSQLEGKTEAPADNMLDGIRMCQRTLLTLCSRFDKLEQAKAVAEIDERVSVDRKDLERLGQVILNMLYHPLSKEKDGSFLKSLKEHGLNILKKYGV